MKSKVILIDENHGRAALLQQALLDAGYEVVAVIHDGDNLLSQLEQTPADIIIIDLESPDRDTLEYLTSIHQNHPKPVVMFAENDDSDMISAAIKAGVSAYIVDGFNTARVKPILEVAIARFREYHAMRCELDAVKNKLAERKLVERAKGILMSHRSMDEATAYHALRKMAMDKNLRLAEVAEQVISISELLL
jgi:response regulator NasT